MSAEETKQPSSIEQLVSLLKAAVDNEPSETQLAELGESLVAAVKTALSGTQ